MFDHRTRTAVFTLQYLAAAGIGLFTLLGPAGAVARESGNWIYLWSGMLLAGGVAAAAGRVGASWRRAGGWWMAESIAQVPLAAPFLIWGLSVLASGAGTRWSAWAFACLCLYVICGCTHRGMNAWLKAREALRVQAVW